MKQAKSSSHTTLKLHFIVEEVIHHKLLSIPCLLLIIELHQQVNFLHYNKPLLHTMHLSNILIIVTDADSNNQHAKKVMSDNLELVNFAIGLVNSVLNLCDGQVMFFFFFFGGGGGSNHRNTVRQIQNSKFM